ncbi:hypothetical protein [Nostoc sp. PA-18-2419]|uniref:hypothetical protein n=1 Tax=Nostoc sp. PA-18-2419 TaxID=2575443 RepID=UPI0011099CB2|nr:hypothetical protein [Nostoc sp. PA-18-2419]
MDKMTEMALSLGIPAFISLLVLYLQERSSMARLREESKSQRNRAFILIEKDMDTLKSTTEKMSVVLDRIDNRIDEFGERISRLEAKSS